MRASRRPGRSVCGRDGSGVAWTAMYPVLFRIGGHAVPSYGLFAATGWMLGIYWWLRQVPHMRWREGEPEFWRLVYLLVGGAIVGGKLLAFLDYRHLASPRE